jgi:hypothetical protein
MGRGKAGAEDESGQGERGGGRFKAGSESETPIGGGGEFWIPLLERLEESRSHIERGERRERKAKHRSAERARPPCAAPCGPSPAPARPGRPACAAALAPPSSARRRRRPQEASPAAGHGPPRRPAPAAAPAGPPPRRTAPGRAAPARACPLPARRRLSGPAHAAPPPVPAAAPSVEGLGRGTDRLPGTSALHSIAINRGPSIPRSLSACLANLPVSPSLSLPPFSHAASLSPPRSLVPCGMFPCIGGQQHRRAATSMALGQQCARCRTPRHIM